ncbi:TonB-dependent receptor [Sphingomonas abietis]|uniref:TonB-dependent receptor n=1 Tax=Sphingomonas abietis TaxID=3012344 RepID=A0ABY7NLJ7_9SPHN|nr:TonB-dependent receptor [Sphingomonas abietis]WBO22420.1 TonB-dependent receptor [Sphingomonas abietis]
MKRLALFAATVAAPALAQSLPPEIVVTGGSLPQTPGDAAYDVATIDRSRLEDNASGRLEDILGDVAGFAQFRRSDSTSAQPTSQGATLRGLGGNASSRALVTLDGVPFTDPFGGWLSYSAIDPERLGLVRVTRGGGSGAFGPGALAGTIELESAGPNQLPPIWADAAYGSRNSVDAHAGVSGTMGGGYGFLSAGYARGDGFVPIVKEDRGPVDEAAPYRQGSLSGRAVFPVWGSSELQASGLIFTDQRTRGTPYQPNSTKGADASLRLVGHGPWGYEALAYVQMRSFSAGFASITSVNVPRDTATQTLNQYSVPSTGLGGKVEVRPPLGEHIQLRIGGDTRYVTGETDEQYQYVAGAPANHREAGGKELTVGGFAEASAEPLTGVTLTAGGRIDHWQIIDGFLHQSSYATGPLASSRQFADRSGWRPTGRGGIAWKPGDGAITLRGAGYLGWRLPTLNELYRPYRVGQDSTVANALLKPERLRGVDAGVDFDPLPTLHVSATVFANRLEDAIGNVTITGASRATLCPGLAATGHCLERENLNAVSSKGAELDARLLLGAWRLSASYAYTDAHVRSDTAIDGLRPAQTARHSASATLGWVRNFADLSATLRYVGPQFEDDQNTETLKSAVTLDATALIPLAHGFSVQLRGENVTNTRVDAAISGDDIIERATPRTLWIGFRYGQARNGA